MSFQLEIIKEGLQLKLEIKSIKEQFLNLLQNYDQFDQETGTMPAGALAESAAAAGGGGRQTPKGLSAARARVRALYDAKKQRLAARRSAAGLTDKVAPTSGAAPYPGVDPSAPYPQPAFLADYEEDKENIAVNALPPRLKARSSARTLAKTAPSGSSQHVPRHHKRHAGSSNYINIINSNTKLLTPIKEEVRKNIHDVCSQGSSVASSVISSPVISDIEGEYVMLKPPSDDLCGNYMNISPDAPFQSIREPCDMNTTSLWINTCDGLRKPAVEGENVDSPRTMNNILTCLSPIRDGSPVKYATSDAISELYTSPQSKSLKDISQISRISHTSVHEQVSGINMNVSGGAFHSTFNYPLHSTLRYPLHSTLNGDLDLPGDITVKSCDEAETGDRETQVPIDARTTVSEPSDVIRSRSLSPRSPSALESQHAQRHLESSYLDKFQPVNNNNQGEPFKLPRPPAPRQRVKKTPQTQVPMLCKEHGLHPNFGGPCIFQTDDSFTLTDDSDLETDSNKKRRSRTITETDCDSSYLSECMETESHGGHDSEELTATYDSKNGRMKMLRRQTGQTALQDKSHLRAPIGLSESDFLEQSSMMSHFDVTRKHLSLVTSRASLPDLSALSTPPSELESDNTLHASQEHSAGRAAAGSRQEGDRSSLDSTLVSSDPRGGGQGGPVTLLPTPCSCTSC